MPPHQSAGADEQARPPVAGEQPGGGCQERPIGVGQPWPPPSPTQDPQLVAEHNVLEIELVEATPDDQAEQPAQKPVADGPEHPVSLTVGWRTCELPGRRADRVSLPHTSTVVSAARTNVTYPDFQEAMAMRIDRFTFGSIRIDGVIYEHDVVIARGRVRKRKKKPSKPFRDAFGHTPLSIEENIPWNCRRLVVGTGADGALPVMDEVRREAARREVQLLTAPTSEAIRALQAEPKETNAILHVTC